MPNIDDFPPIVIELSEHDFVQLGLKMSDFDLELLGAILEEIIQEDYFDVCFRQALNEYADAMVLL